MGAGDRHAQGALTGRLMGSCTSRTPQGSDGLRAWLGGAAQRFQRVVQGRV